MSTLNEMKIDALTSELEKAEKRQNEYHSEIENLIKELVRYETGKPQRDAGLAELKDELEAFKKTIPNFNQETCDLYERYNEMKKEYEENADFDSAIDAKVEKLKKEISSKEEAIVDTKERIKILNTAITKAKSEEN